ncbi:MAG: VOC family protein [Nanoarchaeota archaeon]
MDKVVHFEVPYDDLERAKKFYIDVFGWKIQSMPEMNYNIVHTVDVDEQQMPKYKGAINGGMYKRDDLSAKGPVIVISVQSIDESIKKIEKVGGKIFKSKVSVGQMGFYAQIIDTEGNIIGLWENAIS